jgi:transcription elongation factor Elf1
MPLTGPIPEGGTFFCPHCGALYSVTHSRLSKSDSNTAKCVVCLQIMDKCDSTNVPIYKLIHRPEDACLRRRPRDPAQLGHERAAISRATCGFLNK